MHVYACVQSVRPRVIRVIKGYWGPFDRVSLSQRSERNVRVCILGRRSGVKVIDSASLCKVLLDDRSSRKAKAVEEEDEEHEGDEEDAAAASAEASLPRASLSFRERAAASCFSLIANTISRYCRAMTPLTGRPRRVPACTGMRELASPLVSPGVTMSGAFSGGLSRRLMPSTPPPPSPSPPLPSCVDCDRGTCFRYSLRTRLHLHLSIRKEEKTRTYYRHHTVYKARSYPTLL